MSNVILSEALYEIAGKPPVFDPDGDETKQVNKWKEWSARATLIIAGNQRMKEMAAEKAAARK